MAKNKAAWVIKIGSSILSNDAGQIKFSSIKNIVADLVALKNQGKQIVVVSSGAIACALDILNLNKRPKDLGDQQALAALGQVSLMSLYKRAFAAFGLHCGQILLDRHDLRDKQRLQNISHTLNALLKRGIVPIINENDSVATDEIRVGDNDNLSALVASAWRADMLVLLTDIDGLYESDPKKNPHAKKITSIQEKISNKHLAMAGGTLKAGTTGGMVTKLQAAQVAQAHGINTLILPGLHKHALLQYAKEKKLGTLIYGKILKTKA